jgi:hypothetical protein
MTRNARIRVFIALLASGPLAAQTNVPDIPKLTGPYLGQKAPGKTAESFAPEYFASRYMAYHSGIVFSPDGTEAYWHGRLNDRSGIQGIWWSRLEHGFWTAPAEAPFSICSAEGLDDSPFVTPDGKKLFFLSARPIENESQPEKWRIWFVTRTEKGWSEPKALPAVVNSIPGIHWRLSVDHQGNIYFGAWRKDGTGEIYFSRYENGRYAEPEKLGPEINRDGDYNFSPYIAPDGRYLLFNRRPDVLYVSFKSKDGGWTEARKLEIAEGEHCDNPVVTSDGRYLFLRRSINRVWKLYWVEATIIEELGKKH